MIVPIVGRFSQDEYFVCPREPISVAELRERMLERAKVSPGSYAHRLIYDLHAALFVHSIDIKADYEAYFTREYESFAEYLRRRKHLPSAAVATLTESFGVSIGMFHFRPGHAFLADTYGLEFLTRLIEDSPGGEAP